MGVKVLEWDEEGRFPSRILVNNIVFESEGGGIFTLPMGFIGGLRLRDIPEDASIEVVEKIEEDVDGVTIVTAIEFGQLWTHVYCSREGADIDLIEPRPYKYFRPRIGGRFVPLELYLQTYLKVLRRASKIDPRFVGVHEEEWRADPYDVFVAYLTANFDPDTTIREVVMEVKGFFIKVEEEVERRITSALRVVKRRKRQ